MIREFAMDYSEEDGIVRRGFTGAIRTIAKNQAQGICRLMEGAAPFHWVGLFSIDIMETREFQGIR